jgi:hypothetical protein
LSFSDACDVQSSVGAPSADVRGSHAVGSGSVRSVTPLSQRADATRVERACVIVLTLLGLSMCGSQQRPKIGHGSSI